MELSALIEKLQSYRKVFEERTAKSYIMRCELAHELDFFYSELEMQNEELRCELVKGFTKTESEGDRVASGLRNQLVGVDGDVCDLDKVVFEDGKLVVYCGRPDLVSVKRFMGFEVDGRLSVSD